MNRYAYIILFALLASCSKDQIITLPLPVPGCTSEEAVNFNEAATEDDGSCDFTGCTDPVATNFDPNATINDGSCLYEGLIGCSDPEALNYDSEAIGCGVPPDSTNNDCCAYPLIYGCTDKNALNYNPQANTDDGSCIYPVSFSNDVMPIFNSRCLLCHGEGAAYPLQLAPQKIAYDELIGGANSSGEPYINPKNPGSGYLYELISGEGELVMPLNDEPLTSEQIQTILNWIEQGALNN